MLLVIQLSYQLKKQPLACYQSTDVDHLPLRDLSAAPADHSVVPVWHIALFVKIPFFHIKIFQTLFVSVTV